jgi:hypothetical protein
MISSEAEVFHERSSAASKGVIRTRVEAIASQTAEPVYLLIERPNAIFRF